ncbi:MAG TPA: DUF952 domain-containing protein [Ferruginibacter sp.]|nr:DUF952 domain-containing protein [Ferruginibacter sp.]
MIYHVLHKQDWQKAVQQGFYEAASLAAEGFIHASKAHQVAGVLDRYFKGRDNLVVLHIDEHKLTSPFTYEFSPSVNEEFPHIFGPMNLDAVLKVEEI